MPTPSKPVPTVGEPNAAADPKIHDLLVELVSILTGDVDRNNLKDGEVTAAKIAAAAVTPAKLDATQTYNVGAVQLGGAGSIGKGGSGEYSYGAGFHIFRPASQVGTAELFGSAFNVTSDERLKQEIETLEGALELVARLRGVRFEWRSGAGRRVGLIAQEVAAVLPEAVREVPEVELGDDGAIVDTGRTHLTLDPMAITGLLVQAVGELAERVAKLEAKRK